MYNHMDIYDPILLDETARDKHNTNWNFPSMPSVDNLGHAEYMTEINQQGKPFLFRPDAFSTDSFRAMDLNLQDIKGMFKRNAEVAVGGRINQFADSFFPMTLDEVMPDGAGVEGGYKNVNKEDGGGVPQRLKDRKYEPGILERAAVPEFSPDDEEKPRMYFVYSLNDTEWESFLDDYLVGFPQILNDDKLLKCFGEYRNDFTEKVYWHQLFIGTKDAGMKFHKDA